ncbi:hypothetical protein DAERI_020168 [Deinococcus aerius]|uniref:Uncharacterized protein n=1 Tax=Deinococcus aerius TaxID=200253 RepID=A0A2I9DIK3_9DEIO|nr:hypothetical protein DAERI_020168 [Deinococcus aerius]
MALVQSNKLIEVKRFLPRPTQAPVRANQTQSQTKGKSTYASAHATRGGENADPINRASLSKSGSGGRKGRGRFLLWGAHVQFVRVPSRSARTRRAWATAARRVPVVAPPSRPR